MLRKTLRFFYLLRMQYSTRCIKRQDFGPRQPAYSVKVAAGNIDALTDPTYLGEVLDDTTFSYVCALDDGDDPLNDPDCWIKANPLLGPHHR